MTKYAVRPYEVEAYQNTDPRGNLPEPFASMTGNTAVAGMIKIGRDVVGNLLVPINGEVKTCPMNDWLVRHPGGDLEILKDQAFNVRYAAITGKHAEEPAQEAGEAPAAEEPPAAEA